MPVVVRYYSQCVVFKKKHVIAVNRYTPCPNERFYLHRDYLYNLCFITIPRVIKRFVCLLFRNSSLRTSKMKSVIIACTIRIIYAERYMQIAVAVQSVI